MDYLELKVVHTYVHNYKFCIDSKQDIIIIFLLLLTILNPEFLIN